MTRDDPEVGTEKFCPRCKEWWPADEEFFYFQMRTLRSGSRVRRISPWCKACWAVRNREYRAVRMECRHPLAARIIRDGRTTCWACEVAA